MSDLDKIITFCILGAIVCAMILELPGDDDWSI